jgi:hypothetical protein
MKQSIIKYLQTQKSFSKHSKKYFEKEINKVNKSKTNEEVFKILIENFR